MHEIEIEDFGFFKDDDCEKKQEKNEEISLLIPLQKKDICKFCHSAPIDTEMLKCFDIPVCYSCNKEKLKFITKTNCKQNYLLTDDELKQFKFLTRPNPHKGSWNDMQLYLQSEIEAFSLDKHGSFNEIKEKKNEKKEKRKNSKIKKIKMKIKELKKKTFLPKESEKHIHKFIKKSGNICECSCGMKIDEEEF